MPSLYVYSVSMRCQYGRMLQAIGILSTIASVDPRDYEDQRATDSIGVKNIAIFIEKLSEK